MWNKFKTFFSDLWSLQLASNEFMKHHWLGYIILILAVCIPFWAIIAIHESLEEKKFRKQLDEMKMKYGK